jgi:uncharacterized membrane protein YfcA
VNVPELVACVAGIIIGTLGTLIGAGGGFLIVPLLAVLEPGWTTDQITGFSLAVVTANASTGAFTYWYQKRVDPFSFPLYTLAAVPGAIAGAFVTGYIPRPVFDPVFGGVLVAIAIWLFVRPAPYAADAEKPGLKRRVMVDRAGTRYDWSFDPRIGFAGSVLVGFLSSVLGIGGGIIHVPLLATVLGFPAHVATATSHAVLAVTAGIATVIHIVHGDYRETWPLVLAACAGAVLGAPLGARLSSYVSGPAILRVLATALVFVGLRLIVAR